MHESQARERQELGGGAVADAAERVEAGIRGDSASIGIGQMQVGVAKQTAKNHPEIRGTGSVTDDLLSRRTACRYVAARLADLRSQLRAYLKSQGATLSADAENDMIALEQPARPQPQGHELWRGHPSARRPHPQGQQLPQADHRLSAHREGAAAVSSALARVP